MSSSPEQSATRVAAAPAPAAPVGQRWAREGAGWSEHKVFPLQSSVALLRYIIKFILFAVKHAPALPWPRSSARGWLCRLRHCCCEGTAAHNSERQRASLKNPQVLNRAVFGVKIRVVGKKRSDIFTFFLPYLNLLLTQYHLMQVLECTFVTLILL